MSKIDNQEKRIETIIGANEDVESFEEARNRFFQYLCQNLQLPCDVTGIEDFKWEEPYVFGIWDQDEYKELKKDQHSYEDTFQLLAIHKDIYSEWMLFGGDDLTAEVRRKSDKKKFYLGLAELEAIKQGKKMPSYSMIFPCGLSIIDNML